MEAFEGEEVKQVGAGVQSSYLLVGTTGESSVLPPSFGALADLSCSA